MTVRDVMSARVITIPVDATVATARETLSGHRIQHLAVVNGKRIAGTIWDRDLAGVDDDTRVAEVMDRRFVTISSTTTIRAAAGRLNGRDAGAILVVDGDRLVGIVTASDLVRALAKGSTHLAPQTDRMVLKQRGSRRKHVTP